MKVSERYFNTVQSVLSMRDDIFRAVRLVFSYTPFWTSAGIVLIVILGILPLATLYVTKLLVDTVTSGITQPDHGLVFSHLLFLLVLGAGITLFSAVCSALSSYVGEVQSLVMTDRISAVIQSHSIALDLAYYENPAYHNTFHRAQAEGPSRPSQVMNDIVMIGQSCISITAVGALIISFSPLIGIVLVCSTIPAALIRVWYSKRLFTLRQGQTEEERKGWYYHMLLTDPYAAKEIRLYRLGPFFKERFFRITEELRAARITLSRSRAAWSVVGQGLVTVAVFGSFAVIAFMAINGTITPGDMVMYFMGFQMCTGYVQSIFGGLNSLYEDRLFLHNLFAFFELRPRLVSPEKPLPFPAHIRKEVRMEHVTFTYAGHDKPVLRDVSLTLHQGEIIALVGENGAGKSTLIKLLCRLYELDRGRIVVDGIDLARVDPEEWRKHITILFQDYVHYYLTAQENIALGDIDRGTRDADVKKAARQADVDGVIGRLPSGYESVLGVFFEGGQELSIGEWQKVALARAFFHKADIVILDEPASSLDALTEAEIFGKFRTFIEGRSAIIISHRFSTVMMADHIYVIDGGNITEHGSHAELMAQNGKYATMFRAQADPYCQ